MILSRYVLREHVGPFVFALALLTFVLMMNHILRIFDLILGKGVPTAVVLELFALILPFTFAVTVPMAVLVATLMAFGRLSGDNEITAIRACGVSFYTILRPVLFAAFLIAGALMYFNEFVLPEANHRYAALYADITRKRPTVEIRPGVFIDEFDGYNILIDRIDERTSRIYGVTIYEQAPTGGPPRTILAASGTLKVLPEQDLLQIALENGEIHEVDPEKPQAYRRVFFQRNLITIPGVNTQLVRHGRDYRSDRELPSRQMLVTIADLREEVAESRTRMLHEIHGRLEANLRLPLRDSLDIAQEEEEEDNLSTTGERLFSLKLQNEARRWDAKTYDIDRYLVEVHKKFSVPCACAVFVLLGAPLGVTARRGGVALGLGLSLGFFVVYYVFLIGGEEIADRGMLPPLLAMWLPNIVLGAAGAYLTARTVHPAGLRFLIRRGCKHP
jgi:lipopolysaccharide export system permease protein